MAEKTNILHLRNSIAGGGGVEKNLLHWCTMIDAGRFDVTLACFANTGGVESAFMENARSRGIRTVLIPWSPGKRLFAAVGTLTRVIRDRNIHILHSHDAKSDLAAYLTAQRTGVPVVGSGYAWFGNSSLFRVRLYEWLDVRLMKNFKAIITVCESLRQETISLGIAPEKVLKLYVGVDHDSFLPRRDRGEVRRGLGLVPEDIVIGNFGRLYREKGQSYLLEAFAQVLREFVRAKLVIVGEGPLELELKAQCLRLGIEKNVIWAGFPRDAANLYQILDLQVHSSLYEGLPMAVTQGMAAGVPVIATKVGGVPEIVIHEETGLLLPPGDSEKLAQAMISLLRDPKRSAELARNGQELIRRDHRVETGIRKLEDIYRGILQDS